MRTSTEVLASYDMDEVARSGGNVVWAAAVVLLASGATGLGGLVRVQQGSAVVVQLFGAYVGTIRAPGLRWVSPWSKRRAVSAKVRTYVTPSLKVNDSDGNPAEISVAVVWRVTNTARALFFVDDFAQYVATQSEAAVRHITARYPTEPIVNAGSLYH